MTMQFSVAARNRRADAVEDEMGASPIAKFRTGAKPATCAAADSGAVIATFSLPADAMAAAASGVKAKQGTWEDPSADAAGTIGHLRIYQSNGTTCVAQCDVTITGGGGVCTVDNPVVEAGQDIVITAFGWTEGNA